MRKKSIIELDASELDYAKMSIMIIVKQIKQNEKWKHEPVVEPTSITNSTKN